MLAQDARVAVWPADALGERARLLAALERAFPLTFTPWRSGAAGPAAVLVLGDDTPEELLRAAVPQFTAVDRGGAAAEARLGACDALDRRLRGAALRCDAGRPLELAPGEEVLATLDGAPAWTRAAGPAERHRVGTGLSDLGEDETLRDGVLYRRPLALVALIAFLRTLPGNGWSRPPLRASIVFDDPNLRWRSYGHLDYGRLAEHADAHGYHVAMGMIPLDAPFPHQGAVDLFAARPDRLSLVFHGNNHVRRELMTPADLSAATSLAAQAVRRVERFEQRTGVSVDRVMMPPHGLCSQAMAAALGATGFDALCAIHPLPWTHRPPADQPLAGWAPAQFVDGCAVVPRFPLDCPDDEIALRAFLDQPLVFYGHHEDVAGGLEPLARAAAVVERLGGATWMPLREIVASNVELRVAGARAEVKPGGRRVRPRLPAGVRTLHVERPDHALEPDALLGWSLQDGEVRPFGSDARVDGVTSPEIRIHGGHDVDPAEVRAPRWRPWPRLRRAGAEARDRLRPLRAAQA